MSRTAGSDFVFVICRVLRAFRRNPNCLGRPLVRQDREKAVFTLIGIDRRRVFDVI